MKTFHLTEIQRIQEWFSITEEAIKDLREQHLLIKLESMTIDDEHPPPDVSSLQYNHYLLQLLGIKFKILVSTHYSLKFYTAKDAQVVTSATSCNKVVVNPVSGCVCTACFQFVTRPEH